jgi:hypothetical protein
MRLGGPRRLGAHILGAAAPQGAKLERALIPQWPSSQVTT